jgi:hypothetical protein
MARPPASSIVFVKVSSVTVTGFVFSTMLEFSFSFSVASGKLPA